MIGTLASFRNVDRVPERVGQARTPTPAASILYRVVVNQRLLCFYVHRRYTSEPQGRPVQHGERVFPTEDDVGSP